MNPLASAASAQYENIFGISVPPSLWDCFSVVGVTVILIFGAIFAFAAAIDVAKRRWKIVLTILGVCAILAGISFFVGAQVTQSQHYDTLVAHVNNNLKQKYGVTLSDRNSGLPFWASDENLASTWKLNVMFSDGATAQYNIRFDRNTSEPFIVTTPTADQMNQNANK